MSDSLIHLIIRVLIAAAYTILLFLLQHFLGFRATVLLGMAMILTCQVKLD